MRWFHRVLSTRGKLWFTIMSAVAVMLVVYLTVKT